MKIKSVDVIKLKRFDFSAQTPVLCRINADDGTYGYGEAGVSIMDFTLGSFEVMKSMSHMIIGMDPCDIDVIYSKLSQTFWAQGNGGVIMSAISAIDTALWDLKAKHFNVPLYVLLGGKHRNKLRSYASQLQNGWGYHDFMTAPGDIAFLKDACEKAVDEGYTAVKVDFLGKRLDGSRIDPQDMKNYIPRDLLDMFVSRVAAVRETVGPNVDIIMENHASTSAETAIQFANAAEKYGIMFLEEPCSPMSPIEHKKVSERTNIPLATGERTYTRWGYLPLLENRSVSVLQPDIGNCGGVTECRKIADMAEAFGVTVQTHTCNTPISVAVSLHVEAAIPNFIIHEHHTVNTIPEIRATCVHDYQPVDGYFDIPELPGIGNELTEDALNSATIERIQ
jgi:galactonate dehydratase